MARAPKPLRKRAKRQREASPARPSRTPTSPRRLIVGIGASAGGLQAFKAFFSGMPADSGMAFVLVQHLDPQHLSMMAELIGAATTMPVVAVSDGMKAEANRVHVIPPNATLRIAGGKLRLSMPAPPREHRRPIDTFFSTLAEDQEGNAVGIILSGGGSDGTEGVRAIKEHGGMTIAQADFDSHAMLGMPMSAAETGLVDHVLTVEEIPARLIAYQRHLRKIEPHVGPDGTRRDALEHLAQICAALRRAVGHDFSQYKEKTLVRRIQRRMQVLQIDSTKAYVEALRKQPREAQLLFRELLIGITRFYRDPASFETLATQVIPAMLRGKSAADTVRVWVPGCATGQEAYSIAILLMEAAEKLDTPPQFQIFATDIDERAVTAARAARYPKAEFTDMPADRLERWFAADGDHYCPVRQVRELCIFSTHDIGKDPPFSRLDLISCRNLLIYLETPLQDRLIRTFHYAMRPGGFLMLGPSENASRHRNLFEPLDAKHHIFQRRDYPASLPVMPPAVPTGLAGVATERAAALAENGLEKNARRLMEKHAPAYVVVDANHDVLRLSGQTERYLAPEPGAASLNLFSLLHRSLRPGARAALAKAAATGELVVQEALSTKAGSRRPFVDVAVEPIPDTKASLFVVAFLDRRADPVGGGRTDPAQNRNVEMLENELRTSRERLEAAVEQLETTNEEMRSANEEYQSVNEELQSANEELETSKEEMQSINEELQTVNAELNSKNDALLHLTGDLRNLLDSTQIATLFLDRQLRIRSFTPPTTELFHLRDGDHGRPVTEIVSRLDYDSLRRDATRVMRDLFVIEREVAIQGESRSFLMRARPYRTVDNVIDGVVITFMDITERKLHEQATARLAAIVDSSDDAIIGMNLDGAITSWNRGAETLFGYRAAEVVGQPITLLSPDGRQDEEAEFFQRLKRGEGVDHHETTRRRKDGQLIDVSLTLSPIRGPEGALIGVSKIAQDVTARNRMEGEARRAGRRSRDLMAALPIAAYATDVAGRLESWNQAAVELWGREPTPGEDRWCGAVRLYWPDGRPMPLDQSPMATALKTGTSAHGQEAVAERPDGTRVPFLAYPTILRDDNGSVTGAVNAMIDITDRKRADDLQALMMDELNHRVRNTLATVQAIAQQSLKDVLDQPTRRTFESRLIALAKTHNLVARENWRAVALRDLLLQELRPFRSEGGDRFLLEGPELDLTPKATLALGLAIHELAINAAKYGAFSVPGGRVRVEWDVATARGPAMLRLRWAETGGPPVKPSGRRGFGTTVIQRGLSMELGGKVRVELDPGGLVCTMEIPVSALVDEMQVAADGQ